MKKIFTLIAMACMAIGVNAQSSWVPNPTVTGTGDEKTVSPIAASTLVSDDLMTMVSNYSAKAGESDDAITIGEKSFTTYMQVRAKAAPSTDALDGGQQSNCTPLIITPAKDIDVTMYYRRQYANDALDENDSKDMKVIDQADPTTLMTATSYVTTKIDGDTEYAYATKTLTLSSGKTYTVWAKGSTIRFFGIDYAESTSNGISSVEAAEVEDGAAYNLAGQRVSKDAKGLVIVNGKKYLNK